MSIKHFLINPSKTSSSKEIINSISESKEIALSEIDDLRFSKNEKLIHEEDNLKCVDGRVIIKIDETNKNFHTFSNGTKIRLERKFNNFNRRETEAVNCFVIDSTYIPSNTEILIHPNAIHDSNRIFSYKESNSDIKYYSIQEESCYAYFNNGEWLPLKGFDFALRIFKPYNGIMEGVEQEVIKNCLYVTTGKLKGKAVMTIIACDYEIVFQNKDGREGRLIRFRPFGDKKTNREPEAICTLNDVTEKINRGLYYLGLTASKSNLLHEPVISDD